MKHDRRLFGSTVLTGILIVGLLQRAGPRTGARAVGWSTGRLDALPQSEKCQDREDDHDEADEINDIVHVCPFRMGLRSTSRLQCDVLHTKAYSSHTLARVKLCDLLRAHTSVRVLP
jgi:hypothetical protein